MAIENDGFISGRDEPKGWLFPYYCCTHRCLLMKRISIVLFLCLFSEVIHAQPQNQWLKPGTSWHYGIWMFAFNYPIGFQHYYYAGDTAVGGRIFQIVKGEEQLRTTLNGVSTVNDTTGLATRYFHTSNDTVYILRTNNTLQFAWHNNPVVGEVWDFGLQLNPAFAIPTYQHVYSQVDSVRTVTMGGITMKEIFSHAAQDSLGTPISFMDPYQDVPHVARINTRFGPVTSFNLIDYYSLSTITDGPIGNELRCFEANDFPLLQVSGSDCNNGIFSAVPVLEEQSFFAVFPNPTEGVVHTKCYTSGDAFCLYNSQGQQVMFEGGENLSSINLSGLPSGLYAYVLYDGRFGNIKQTGRILRK